MEKLEFGKKLFQVRNAKGLTQEEIAKKCHINVRTIQRIESGLVTPRAFTINIISETLGFDFFETSNAGYDVIDNQHSKLENHSILWYVKDLFNFKTNTMKKVSILSMSLFLIVFAFVLIVGTNAQTGNRNKTSCITIEYNQDKSIKRIEADFNNSLTLDSLLRIKSELNSLGITINYKKLEFDTTFRLSFIDCEVDGNLGNSGSFAANLLSPSIKNNRFGFYCDYSKNAKSTFGTGRIN